MNEIQLTNLDPDTKRFLLSAMCLQGMLSGDRKIKLEGKEVSSSDDMAMAAVNFADCLLEALERIK